MSLTAVILAAGRSTRMKSRRPKPLHEICGRPMLEYILRACWAAGCAKVIVIVGYGKEEVMAHFGGDHRIHWCEQAEQLGTGHAVRCAEAELRKAHGEVFVLAGDVPLIRGQVLKTLLKAHRDEKVVASMATAMLDDPTGYGRIVRDENGEFVRIVEQVDATPQQREIREVFPSYYCVRAEELVWALGQLKNDNKKGEFYLTDIYEHIRKSGKRVLAVQAVTAEDVLAPNSRQDLAMADMVMQERIQREHREAGVTIVSPINTYIEDGASIGVDVTIQPFSFIGRDASIGAECTIGPFAFVPRNSVVREGTTVAGNVSRETALMQVEP
jgi:bifunctional UDP-N-acetylglucosamine pyrophosphorylase/glucosamine-1-phosphate N-acetyltransferase